MEDSQNELNVLVLNASLKHAGGEISNTEEVAQMIIKNMEGLGQAKITSEIIRLADKNIMVGLKFDEGNGDEWPEIAAKIRKADIIIFATPIWWGGRSSLMQRIIERLDAFDEEVLAGGRAELLNKVAGIVITGSEDGAQATLAGIMEVLTFMNFTLPPQCCTYWVGEVGEPPATDRERRLKNAATPHMAQATARNLVYYANLLKKYPLTAQ
ncbi:MAG TPA: NAD(P)H-dependent oxidoreductase [Candidatus Paceibacterota bacterium]